MGITRAKVPSIIECINYGKLSNETKCLMLGHQDVYIDRSQLIEFIKIRGGRQLNDREELYEKLTSEDFFRHLGFKDIHSMDISDYEGADIIFDLNNPLPEKFKKKYSYVFDIGTLEHIYDIKTAMENISEMCVIGGIVYHDVPYHIEHGYHSISPNLFTDYYMANKWDLISCKIRFDKPGEEYSYWTDDIRYYRTREKTFECVQSMIEQGYYAGTCCIARKIKESTSKRIPQQSFYEKKWGDNLESKACFSEKIEQISKKVAKFIASRMIGSVAIYGTGDVFNKIINNCIKYEVMDRIYGVLDGNEDLLGEIVRGCRIVSLNEINKTNVKYVIVASVTKNQDIIYNRIKDKINKHIKIVMVSEIDKELGE